MHPGPRTELLVVAVGNVVVLVVGFGIVCGVVPCAIWGIIFAAAAYCVHSLPPCLSCLLQQLLEVGSDFSAIFNPLFSRRYSPPPVEIVLASLAYVRDGLGSV